MAAQLALQRNFVTITPSAQITATSVPTNQVTTTLTTTTTNGEIVTIAEAAGQVAVTEASTTPIHIMQTHTQVTDTFFSAQHLHLIDIHIFLLTFA